MKKFALFFCGLIFANLAVYSQDYLAQSKLPKDTLKVYKMPSLDVITDKGEFGQSPIPFSKITSSEISKSYIYQDVPEMISDLPSIYSYSQNGNGIGYSTMSIRGFDQRRISVYVNGIPQNDPEDHNVYWIDFPDIASNTESIEIQRGAGLTSYGSASIGGSINLATSDFITHKGVKIYSGFGFQQYASEENSFKQQISKHSFEVSSGLINSDNNPETKYAFYSRLSRINSFGYRDISWAYLNSYFIGAVRFDKNLTTQINVFGGPLSDGLAYNGIPKAYVNDPELRRKNYNYWNYDSTGKNVEYLQPRRNQEIEEFSQPHFELLNDLKINENFNFKSSLFYYSGEGYFDYDGTGWTNAESYQLNEKNGYPNSKDPQNPLIRAYVLNNQWGWIPRIEYKSDNYQWISGLEIRFHRSNHWGKLQYAEDLPLNYDQDFKFYEYDGARNILSAFSSFQTNLTQNFSLFADVQLVNHSYSINNEKSGKFYTVYNNQSGYQVGNGGDLFNINYYFVNPKVGLTYILNQSSTVYGFAAMTSGEPRMANLYNASEAFSGAKPQFEATVDPKGNIYYNFEKPLVKPERLYDFETGYNLKSDNFSFSLNYYYMLYKDELVKSGQMDFFGDPIDGNAPQTFHSGIELSGNVKLFKSIDYGEIEFLGNLSFSQNKIIDYNFKIGNGESISLKDNPVAGFPNLLANLKFQYSLSNLYAGISIKLIGNSKTDNFGDMMINNPKLKSYLGSDYYTDNNLESFSLLNFDLSYKFQHILTLNTLTLQLKINNVLNTLYASGAEGKEFFPGAERNIFIGMELGL